MLHTIHLHFTEMIPSIISILLRIRRMSPVVVVDDVSTVVRTGDVDRIRYRGCGVVGIPKTQQTFLFVCCVGDVNGEAKESTSVLIAGIYIFTNSFFLNLSNDLCKFKIHKKVLPQLNKSMFRLT